MSLAQKRSMIQRDHPDLSVSQQCKLVQLSRSAFYYTLVGIDADTLAMMKEIDRVFTKYPFFGSRQLAALCGVSPVPASSGKTTRHRLNRGADRAANSALHIIAIGRLRLDPKTKEYVARRTAQGHSKLEAIRCLKRYIAREVFNIIARRHKQIRQVQIAA